MICCLFGLIVVFVLMINCGGGVAWFIGWLVLFSAGRL